VKGFSYFLKSGLLALAMIVACSRVSAQQFGLSVVPSSNPILVGNSLTYIITVTNLNTGTIDAVVTNFLPASVLYQSATNYYSYGNGAYLTNSVVFGVVAFPGGNIAQMSVTVVPTAAGSITDTVIVASTDYNLTNTFSTNVVVQVTNAVNQADLGVTMTGPNQVVITNDWMTYGVTVTNSGPNTATGVALTNTLPPGVISISPTTNQAVGSNIISVFPLGTLANGGSTNLQFTVQPTNVTNLLFSVAVGSGVPDTNTANNFASTNIIVTNYLPGTLVVVTNSGQSIDFANGSLKQSITLSNAGLSSVPAARIVVNGLTNRLFNAVGTNDGNPFVYYSAPLAAGQSVGLLLEYFPRTLFAFTNSQLQAYAVPMPNWTPPAATGTSTNINISRIVELPNGNMVLEWSAVTNQTYTVVYSDNVLFSNAMIAPPSIVAPANIVEWTDYGPPETVSAPTNAGARFYRVLQNP
jgi:uncharacterized repeat protein (TIGR01451 family)